MKFTDRFVATIPKPETRKVLWEDADYGKGSLGLRISPNGAKTWVYMYQDPRTQKRRMATLGRYPQMGVRDANEAYTKAIDILEAGENPVEKWMDEKEEERSAPTVGAMAEEYMERWAKPNKRSWKEDQRMLNLDVIPAWGEIKVKDITRRDVIRLMDKIMERGSPIAANRTLAMIRRMFNFAVERAVIEYSPIQGVKAPAKEQQKDRALSNDEIYVLWNAMWHNQPPVGMDEPGRMALLFQLSTGCRPQESVALRWGEIKEGWWTLPSIRAKGKVLNRIPLSPIALDILERSRRRGTKDYVFASEKFFPAEERPMVKGATAHAIHRELESLQIQPFTPHDLRRTAATHMSELGVSRIVIAKILNHTDQTVTAIYDRHTYDAEKKEALNAWSEKLIRVTGHGSS